MTCQFDESTEISLVRWNDNSIVIVISAHCHVQSIKSTKTKKVAIQSQRWCDKHHFSFKKF